TIRFDQTCLGVDLGGNQLRFRNEVSGAEYSVDLAPTIATDGAGSAVRNSLLSQGQLSVREDWLEHDYKELTIPPVNGRPALDPNALHIWPRGGFMLIALPNTDLSFTATLFLARSGLGLRESVRAAADGEPARPEANFEALSDAQAVLDF